MFSVRRLLSPAVPVIAVIGEIWLAIGVLLRLIGWRDRFAGLSLVYYSTPWAVIAAGFAALAVYARWRQQMRTALVRGLVAIAAGVAWLATCWYMGSPSSASPDFRLVLWNVRNNGRGFDGIAARLKEFSPDVIALAEAGTHLSDIPRWRGAFPEYAVERLPGQMLSMSKGGLQRGSNGLLDAGSFYGIHTTQIRGRQVTVVQTDINAEPRRSREAALKKLTELVREHFGEPLIVLGDFNTPRQSWHLDPIRGMLTHAFEAHGSGLADTWPIPCPVLSLDQVWVSPQLEVVSCRQGWSLLSDHRAVFVELRFK
ncbi:endonuclease/exonuclease/phosphatase family protein [Verrucomicrobiota bacterium sgz303538]